MDELHGEPVGPRPGSSPSTGPAPGVRRIVMPRLERREAWLIGGSIAVGFLAFFVLLAMLGVAGS